MPAHKYTDSLAGSPCPTANPVAAGNSPAPRAARGFSLIELMITVSVVAILATLAYPSYASFIRKAKRVEAQAELMNWANRQMSWRADHPSYSATIRPNDTDNYAYTIVFTASSFTLTATALNDQLKDKESGTACTQMSIDQDGAVGPSGYEKCWRK